MTNSETQVVGPGRDFWGHVSDFKANFNLDTAGSSPAGQNCLGAMVPWRPSRRLEIRIHIVFAFVYSRKNLFLKSFTSIPMKVFKWEIKVNLRETKRKLTPMPLNSSLFWLVSQILRAALAYQWYLDVPISIGFRLTFVTFWSLFSRAFVWLNVK